MAAPLAWKGRSGLPSPQDARKGKAKAKAKLPSRCLRPGAPGPARREGRLRPPCLPRPRAASLLPPRPRPKRLKRGSTRGRRHRSRCFRWPSPCWRLRTRAPLNRGSARLGSAHFPRFCCWSAPSLGEAASTQDGRAEPRLPGGNVSVATHARTHDGGEGAQAQAPPPPATLTSHSISLAAGQSGPRRSSRESSGTLSSPWRRAEKRSRGSRYGWSATSAALRFRPAAGWFAGSD